MALLYSCDDVFRSSALLGLIDDVDCAVVSMAFTRDPASPVQLQHVATIPALAYVATGAPAKKGRASCSCIHLQARGLQDI